MVSWLIGCLFASGWLAEAILYLEGQRRTGREAEGEGSWDGWGVVLLFFYLLSERVKKG